MKDWSFTAHPRAVGETYLKHMGTAASFGWAMLKGTGACFVHALLPFLFTRTGSGIFAELHGRTVTHRRRSAADPAHRGA